MPRQVYNGVSVPYRRFDERPPSKYYMLLITSNAASYQSVLQPCVSYCVDFVSLPPQRHLRRPRTKAGLFEFDLRQALQDLTEFLWRMSSRYCNRCAKTFDSLPAKQQHVKDSRNHHLCHVCSSPHDYATEDELDEHLESQHYICVPCDKQFRRSDDLERHDIAKHNLCAKCQRYFDSPANLKSVSTVPSRIETDSF